MLELEIVESVNPLISSLFTKVPLHSTSRKAFRLPLDFLKQFPPIRLPISTKRNYASFSSEAMRV